MNLETLQAEWVDTEQHHNHINDLLSGLVNKDFLLNRHRNWVEGNIWGFGERSFHYLWKILLEELPQKPKLLEIGCFRGQTLSLFKLLRSDATVFGITPLSTEGGMWESDYGADIKRIHEEFNVDEPTIFPYLSEDTRAINIANDTSPYHVIYIDGGHERRHIDNDLTHYAPLVKPSGFLVIDDACCDMHMPWGFFQGIQPVTDGVLAYMAEHGDKWDFVFSVVHLRIYRRK